MAALGLGVDVRTVAKAGPAVTATVTLSLLLLVLVSLGLIPPCISDRRRVHPFRCVQARNQSRNRGMPTLSGVVGA